MTPMPTAAPPGVSARAFSETDASADGSRMRMLSEADLANVDVDAICCRGCSGYGSCGYRTYYLRENGLPLNVCERRKECYAAHAKARLRF